MNYRNDNRLSYRARGILQHLLDIPPGQPLPRARDLEKLTPETKTSCRNALAELAEYGYYEPGSGRGADGRYLRDPQVSSAPVAAWLGES